MFRATLRWVAVCAGVRLRVESNQLQLHALVDMIPFNHIVVVFSP